MPKFHFDNDAMSDNKVLFDNKVSFDNKVLFDNKGEGFIELALVLILVAIVLIVILLLLGPNIREFFNSFGLINPNLTSA